MPYDANPAATFDPSVGGTPTAAWLDIYNANFAHLGGAWTSFTPTLTATTTNPTVGNGTLTGGYMQAGKLLVVSYSWTFGSSSAAGSGTYSFTLPNSLTSAARKQVISGYLLDSGTAHYVAVGVVGVSSTTFPIAVDGSSQVAHNVPFAWATGDELRVEGVIEVA